MLTPISVQAPAAAPPDAAARREAASDLARAFLTEMIKTADLIEAFDKGDAMSGTLSHHLADAIASEMTKQQPGLVDAFYTALSRGQADE